MKKDEEKAAREEKIAELEIFKQSFEEKKTEAQELNDKFMRINAEFDNYKKRVANEKRDLIDYAHKDIVTALLPIIDSFEKALEPHKEGKEEFVKGMNMIFISLMAISPV